MRTSNQHFHGTGLGANPGTVFARQQGYPIVRNIRCALPPTAHTSEDFPAKYNASSFSMLNKVAFKLDINVLLSPSSQTDCVLMLNLHAHIFEEHITYSSSRGKLRARFYFMLFINLSRSSNLYIPERYHLHRLPPPRWANVSLCQSPSVYGVRAFQPP